MLNRLLAVAVPALVMLVSACQTPLTTAIAPRQGAFISAEHPTAGMAKLFNNPEGKVVLQFDSSFRTDAGPDLFVVLHRAPNVVEVTQPPTYALKEGDYVIIAPLKSTTGEQSYDILSNINLGDYQSVAIWCRQFNATFGAAPLLAP